MHLLRNTAIIFCLSIILTSSFAYAVPNITITMNSGQTQNPLLLKNSSGGNVFYIDPSGRIFLAEATASSTPPANSVIIYSRDKAGISELFYKNDAGTERDLSSIGGADTKVNVFEIGVQVGSVARQLDFTNGNDFTIAEDAVNDQFDISITRNSANGIAGLDSGSRIVKAQAPATTVYTDQVNTYAAGFKQSFDADATNADIRIVGHTADPSTLENGDIWYDSTANKFRGREGGVSKDLIATGGSAHNLLSSTHPDTVVQTVSRGSLIIGKTATPVWDELVIGGANTVLASDGTDGTWTTLVKAHLPASIAYEDEANVFTLNQEIDRTAAIPLLTIDRPEVLADDTRIYDEVGKGLSSTSVSRNYTRISSIMEDDTNTAEDGSLLFQVIEAGTLANYVQLNDAFGVDIDLLKPVNFNSQAGTNLLLNADTNTITNIDDNEIKAGANIAKSKISTTGTWVKADLPAAVAYEDEANVFTLNQEIDRTAAIPTLTIDRPEVLADNTAIYDTIGKGLSSTSVSRDYTRIRGVMAEDTNTAEDGGLLLSVIQAGTLTDYIKLNDAIGLDIDMMKPVNFNSQTGTNFIIGTGSSLGATLDVVGNTLDNVGIINDNSGAEAGSGFIRVGNAVNALCWEQSPAGADICQLVDASENYIFDADINNIDMNSNPLTNGVLGGQLNINGQTFLNTGVLTFPTATTTLIGRDTTDTLTNKILRSAGTGNTVTADPRIAILTAGGATLQVAATPSRTTIDGTNMDYVVIDFDTTVAETVIWNWEVPAGMDAAADVTATIRFHITGTAGVCWDGSWLGRTTDEAVDAAFGTVIGGCDSATVTGQVQTVTLTFTSAQHGLAASDVAFFKLTRDVADATDTNVADARVVDVKISWS